jgi:hypothetical protein
VFLARLLVVYGTDAPEQLRRVADEPASLMEAEVTDKGRRDQLTHPDGW